MQESSYRVSAKNKVDFGIGQINVRTIKNFNFDQEKLLSDLTYSIEAAAIVLADFKRMYGKREQDYWSRYNTSTPSKREVYRTLVARYM